MTKKEKYEKLMQQWDYWRERVANGDKSSAPRDWFESVVSSVGLICKWRCDKESGYDFAYITECEHHVIYHSSLAHWGYYYCPFCGGEILLELI